MKNEFRKTLREAIELFGSNRQMQKAVEELAELIRAITRQDGQNIIEEIADVRIMLEQVEMILDIHDEVRCEMAEKVEWLKHIVYDVQMYEWSKKPDFDPKLDEMLERVKAGAKACANNPQSAEDCEELGCLYQRDEDCIQHMCAEALACITKLEGNKDE